MKRSIDDFFLICFYVPNELLKSEEIGYVFSDGKLKIVTIDGFYEC